MTKIQKVINEVYDGYVMDIINKKFPTIRKHKYSGKYCLDMFKHILKTVSNWRSLSFLKDYNGKKYHYKYLNQVFNKWVENDVFKDAYTNMLNDKYFQLKHIKKNKNLNLFIDSTFINNMYGVDGIANNPEYRKKKVTKISVIADDQNNILGVLSDSTHPNNKNKPSVAHDVKLVQKTLDNMNVSIPTNIITRIGGDKGYITQKRFKLNNNKKMPIIARKRKNQLKQNTKRQLQYLKRRYTVEISIAFVKKYTRLVIRRDKKLSNYVGFVYLALLDLFCVRNK